MTTLVVLQPSYLPWIGFFDQMSRSDIFIHYDDVQFDKHGWRNRNRIKSLSGPLWLTVPVRHRNLEKPRIMDIVIDKKTPWLRKHLGSIQQYYSKAPFFDELFPSLQKTLSEPYLLLVDLNISIIQLICEWLEINCTMLKSSELNITGEKSTRLLKICQTFNVDHYLSGSSAKNYLNTGLFEKSGVIVEWHDYQHPEYSQQYQKFLPYLSIIDLMFNVGIEKAKYILNTKNKIKSGAQ